MTHTPDANGWRAKREAIAQAAYEGHVARNKPWRIVSAWEKARWLASADAVILALADVPAPLTGGENG